MQHSRTGIVVVAFLVGLSYQDVQATEDPAIEKAYAQVAKLCVDYEPIGYAVFSCLSAPYNRNQQTYEALCAEKTCNGKAFSCSRPCQFVQQQIVQLTLGGTVPNPPNTSGGIDHPTCLAGSIIRRDNQGVGEVIPIVGTSVSLVYTAERTLGRQVERTIQIPLLGASPQGNIVSVTATGLIAGGTFTQTLSAAPNLQTSYLWNGLNANGVSAPSSVANITISQSYSDNTIDIPLSYTATVYNPRYNSFGIDGWSLSNHHFYDANAGVLYLGDGSLRYATSGTNAQANLLVASADGAEVYVFSSSSGLHLQTLQARTGTVLQKFAYSGGLLASMTDAYGNVISVLRDGSGNLNGIKAPFGQVTSISLNSNGEIYTVTNPNSEQWQMTYYSNNLLYTFQKPKGQISTMVYDSQGNLLSDSSTAGNSTTLSGTYVSGILNLTSTTAQNYQTSSQLFGSPTMGAEYDRTDIYPDGNQVAIQEIPNSISSSTYPYMSSTTNYGVDPLLGSLYYYPHSVIQFRALGGNLPSLETQSSLSQIPQGETGYFSYTSLTSTYTFNQESSTSTFTLKSGVTANVSAAGRKSTSTKNKFGKLTATQLAKYLPTQFSYDSHGRLQTVSQGTRSSTIAYDPDSGFAQYIVNASGGTTSFIYDGAGRVKQTTLPDNRFIQFSYDADGNLSEVIPPGSQAHNLNSTPQDLLGLYSPPPLGSGTYSTQYNYNNDGQLIGILRPDQTQIAYNYNPNTGQLSSIVAPNINNSFSYVPNDGRLSSVQSDDATVAFGYTGEFVSSSTTTLTQGDSNLQSSLQVDYDYYLLPRGIALSTAGGARSNVSFSYDMDNLLTQAGSETLTPSPTTGLLTGTVLGKVKDSYSYDPSYADLQLYSAKSGSKTILGLSFTRDAQSRIAIKTEDTSSGTTSYQYVYDPSGRLTDVLIPSGTYSHFGYDSNSNRKVNIIGGRGSYSATYDAQDRLSTFGQITYNFDLNGNLQTKTDNSVIPAAVTQYNFDGLGNLVSVTLPNGTLITYLIDGMSRRIGKKVNGKLQYLWQYLDQTRIASQLTGNGQTLTQFVYASKNNVPDQMIIGSSNYRIISDAVGSPRFVVNTGNGKVMESINYDDLGMVSGDSKPGFTPFGYAGGLYDTDTGLCLMGARSYDPQSGRWISKDPSLFYYGGGPNLYGYAFSDPVNFIDINGLWAFQIGGSLAALFPALGAGIESGVGISYSAQYGLQIAGYQTAQVRAGVGLYGGPSLNFTVTPGATSISDLQGTSVGGGADTPGFGISAQVGQKCGKPLPSGTVGVGPGLIGDIYGSVNFTHVSPPITIFGGGH